MIDYIAVTNSRNERLVMPLKNPYESGFNVMSVDGLGPSKGTINVTDISSRDGSVYNSSRVGVRNMTLTLGFVDNPAKNVSIEDIRLKSYRYFRVKDRVTVEVKTDKRHINAVGYIESNEPDIFSQTEGCDISIIFPDPYLYEISSDGSNIFDFSSRLGGFEFPFNNDLPGKHIEFATLNVNTETNIPYPGDFAIGFVVTFTATGPATGLRIARRNPDQWLDINYNMVDGDVIILDTRVGKKSLKLIRGGVEMNIIHTLGISPTWFAMTPGDNIFSYTAKTGVTNVYASITYYTAYLGV